MCVINENNNVHELELGVGLATSSLDRKACRRFVSYQLSHIDAEPITQISQSHELRSFLHLPRHSIVGVSCNNSRILPYSKLLRVLNMSLCYLNHLPREIVDLVHLRYLALSIDKRACFNGYQLCKLRCLQTIIITNEPWHSFSPNNILGMPQIRHVHFSPRTLYYHHLPKLVQGNLQTLSWLSLPQRLQTEPDFKAIPNVKELGIHLMGFTWDLQPHISMEGLLNLHQLENLKFERDGGCLKCDSKVLKAFPSNLKKLTLIRTNFSWEDMAIISTLPNNLEVLKLREDAFCGPEWKATGNGFCKLKYLEVIRLLSLKHWSVDADHFPILECIFLYLCPDLVEFPTGFGEINTLRLIDLKRCHLSLVTSAKKFQEERRDLGDDRLVLREFYTYRLIGTHYEAIGSEVGAVN
nr:putative late blight resistance protein homolog R1B-14 isoform X1 [Ipomoea batatas]